MTNDTRKRGLWRLNIALPERIEAALFNPRLDKLTVEPPVMCEASLDAPDASDNTLDSGNGQAKFDG